MEERGGEEQVGSEASVELRCLPADRRDRDRVLEEAARVRVVAVSRGRVRAQAGLHARVAEDGRHRLAQRGVVDLRDEEVEESLELGHVPSCRGSELRRIGVGRRLDRADLELQAVAVALHATQHAHGVALAEAPVEELDVAPDARVDAPARVDELEREVGIATASPQPLLASDGVGPLDDPVLGELGDRRHRASLGPLADGPSWTPEVGRRGAGTLRRVAEVEPFRAVRYDARRAGPLASLVAPPYDVVSAVERERLRAASPYNVAHLTLPDTESEAAELWHDWQADGVLVREERPAFWVLVQDYVGPDGIRRTRTGLVASLTAEQYERRVVLPHERTHAGPKEGRLRLLRAVRAHLEPIFLLYDAEAPFAVPDRDADIEAEGARLWRLEDDGSIAAAFRDRQLLIADGHHRYETTLAFHAETGTPGSRRLLAVLVSARDPGLMIFPTHRRFREAPGSLGVPERVPVRDPETGLRELERLPRDRAAVVVYERGRAEVAVDGEGELDVRLVDRLGHEGIEYTPDWRDAVRAVDAGDAAVAFLMRPTRIEDVFAVARRGETMPQKSTYFYPKLLSGLLLHPV